MAKISFQDVKDVFIFSYLTVEMTGQQYFKLCDVSTFYPTQKKSVWMYIKNQEVNSLEPSCVYKSLPGTVDCVAVLQQMDVAIGFWSFI